MRRTDCGRLRTFHAGDMMDENKKRPNLEMLGTNELPTDVEGGRILPINLVVK